MMLRQAQELEWRLSSGAIGVQARSHLQICSPFERGIMITQLSDQKKYDVTQIFIVGLPAMSVCYGKVIQSASRVCTHLPLTPRVTMVVSFTGSLSVSVMQRSCVKIFSARPGAFASISGKNLNISAKVRLVAESAS
jgi:hypothetical protein